MLTKCIQVLPNDHMNAFACQSDSGTNAFRVQFECIFGAPNDHLNACACESDSETHALRVQLECSRNAFLVLQMTI